MQRVDLTYGTKLRHFIVGDQSKKKKKKVKGPNDVLSLLINQKYYRKLVFNLMHCNHICHSKITNQK